MQKVNLGLTGMVVSEICFGSLAISPLQGRVSAEQGTEVLRYAVSRGIDWIDTAEIYDNYPQLKPVLMAHQEVKVISKSYAVTKDELDTSLEKARHGLGRDKIDIFLLHEQESSHTLRGHAGAWEGLLQAKERGLVGAIGISTHAVQGVRAGALQPGLDVIHPLINYMGLGIIDGCLSEMLDAIQFAAELGTGVYAMKVFGGGHLAADPEKAVSFIRSIPWIQAMALGMSSILEVDFNLALLKGEVIPDHLRNTVLHRERKLYIADWCQGCGKCVEGCPQDALYIEEDQACLQADKCILCGYCGRYCPHFCLKIV